MTRSDLASEAVRRPKQPQKNLLEKIRMVSQSSVNEFQEVISIFFCQRVSGGYLNLLSSSLKAKYPKETAPPMAAAGLLGPDLVSNLAKIVLLTSKAPNLSQAGQASGVGGVRRHRRTAPQQKSPHLRQTHMCETAGPGRGGAARFKKEKTRNRT